MKKYPFIIAFFFAVQLVMAQNVGIVRENYYSTYYDSSIMMEIEVLDSATIRLGSVNPATGVVSNVGSTAYNTTINLTGATIDPYLNRYYIGKGFNYLTFDINTGDMINDVPIYGPLPSSAFQNFRFNNSDSTIYGMVPNNFYSTYYDSSIMMEIEVLDSAQIRFASLNPQTGEYTLIGSSSYSNLYTLAGNSIDPYQMLYYYSAVDTLIGIDLYTGEAYSTVPILLPPYGIFENIAYSCVDTSIYGMTRQNYVSTIYDSLLMEYTDVIDSTTFRLSKINPNTGEVTFVSPINIRAGGNLTGGAFIDPSSMTYYFSDGYKIAGVSMVTGLITSSVLKTYSGGAFAYDMMRSTENCFGATRARYNISAGVDPIAISTLEGSLFPNPSSSLITVAINAPLSKIEIVDSRGNILFETKEKTIDISSLPSGLYFSKVMTETGQLFTSKFIKN